MNKVHFINLIVYCLLFHSYFICRLYLLFHLQIVSLMYSVDFISYFVCRLYLFFRLQIVAGEVDMALGGDQGGSVRVPSSWTGCVGLKPTWGLVPVTGSIGLLYKLFCHIVLSILRCNRFFSTAVWAVVQILKINVPE